MKTVRVWGFLPQLRRALLVLVSICIATPCSASRVSGTYVGHGSTFAEMLQLTESGGGQLSGVLSSVTLHDNGKVNAEQMSITGVVDGDQITLTVHSFLSGSSLGGTIRGNTIQLQTVDSKGNVSSSVFIRNTPDAFTTFADELKSKGEGIVFSSKLLNGARELRQMVQSADNWMSTAEVHAGRMANVRVAYQRIEEKMQVLVDRERATRESLARSQIAVEVSQGDVAGSQTDIEVNQIWDLTIGNPGLDLAKAFANWDGNCGTPQDLQKRGASGQAIEAWLSACRVTLDERAKFGPVFKRIMDQRNEVKALQATAEAHRKALVIQATRME